MSAFGALEPGKHIAGAVGENGIFSYAPRADKDGRRKLEPLSCRLEKTVKRGQPLDGDETLEQAKAEVGDRPFLLNREACFH